MKKIHIMAGDFSTPEELQEYLGDVFLFLITMVLTWMHYMIV